LNTCVHYSLIDGETIDITPTTQMFVIERGVTSDFEAYEELVDLSSMQSQTKGSVFTLAFLCFFRSIIWNYLTCGHSYWCRVFYDWLWKCHGVFFARVSLNHFSRMNSYNVITLFIKT